MNGVLELLSAPLVRYVANSPEVQGFVERAESAVEGSHTQCPPPSVLHSALSMPLTAAVPLCVRVLPQVGRLETKGGWLGYEPEKGAARAARVASE